MDNKTWELLQEKIDGIVSTTDRIEKHVLATNGRVKKLELWRSALLGGWAVLMFIFGLCGKEMYSAYVDIRFNLDDKISTAIKSELSDKYEIEIK